MSKYTTELRYICETYAGLDASKGYNDIDSIISASWHKIFNFNFPIFEESYRESLCSKIILHYYTQEIAVETVGLWQYLLKRKMFEIMPYYNKLYKAWSLEFNPIENENYTRNYQRNTDSNNILNSENNQSHKNWNMYSDTPQGSVSNLENETYLSTATKDTGNTNANQNSTNKYDEQYDGFENIKGKTGSQTYQSMLKDYADALLNIDMMIIDDLQPLFMGLW